MRAPCQDQQRTGAADNPWLCVLVLHQLPWAGPAPGRYTPSAGGVDGTTGLGGVCPQAASSETEQSCCDQGKPLPVGRDSRQGQVLMQCELEVPHSIANRCCLISILSVLSHKQKRFAKHKDPVLHKCVYSESWPVAGSAARVPLLDGHTLPCSENTKEASSIIHLTATCCRTLSMHQNIPAHPSGIIWSVGRSSQMNLYANITVFPYLFQSN